MRSSRRVNSRLSIGLQPEHQRNGQRRAAHAPWRLFRVTGNQVIAANRAATHQTRTFQNPSQSGARKRLIFQQPSRVVSVFQKDLFLELGSKEFSSSWHNRPDGVHGHTTDLGFRKESLDMRPPARPPPHPHSRCLPISGVLQETNRIGCGRSQTHSVVHRQQCGDKRRWSRRPRRMG